MKEEETMRQKSEIALREEAILDFWKKEDIFTKSDLKDHPKGDFVFFEGPPTANGKPGIHHVEARSFKDVIPRYKTMRGFRVERKAGWDTHGLPVELQVEKELGLKSKKEIEQYGIAEFNKKCKTSVLQYIDIWKSFTERIGYWTDFEKAYFTFNNSYIESLWNIVSEIEKKNLLYKDYKVLPWCPRCGTALSSHELAQGYQDTKDLSVFVKFRLTKSLNEGLPTYILAWTTTPWTLPGNVALAVGKEIEYVKVKIQTLKVKDEIQNSNVDTEGVYVLAKDLIEKIFANYEYEVLEEVKGSDLIGLEYEPLFPFLKDNLPDSEKEKLPNAFKVYDADFVTTTDGTGVVHTAVMYGQDDFVLGTQSNLPKFHLVKEDGTFKEFCGFLSDRFVKETNEAGKPTLAVDIIDDLKKRNLFFAQENYKHSYPHCWRCKTPLIYFARDSWYIKMSTLRDTMVVENEKINWEPDYIKEGRFGEWLRDIKDWAVSRERYWGTPLPVWETEDKNERIVIDSIETLKKYTKKSGNKYFLMRHGEAEHNLKGVISSDNDNVHSLTEKGRKDVCKTAEELKKKNIDIIFYSPLRRSKETFEEVSSIIQGVESYEDNRLREEGFGELSGRKFEDLKTFFPDFKARLYNSVSGSETLLDVKKRIGNFLYEIDEKFSNKNILIITHDGPAKMFEVVGSGADTDQKIEQIYRTGKEYIPVGDYREFDFTPIPHDEDYKLDLHKPFIDFVSLEKDGKKLTRVKEVMDVWFDSGAMPFAQVHYPFKNKEYVDNKKGFPADFISEAIDQTRGWFYTLHAVSNLLGKGIAYKNVICLGHLLDKDGKKMSKSLGNVINPWEMADKYGIDTIRLWMYSVNQPGESKNFDERTVDDVKKKIINVLDNALSFYELGKNDFVPKEGEFGKDPLDRWIVSRLSHLQKIVTEKLDNFKLLEPVREIRGFLEDFSTWYIRRSRDRVREGDVNALQTMYFVLKNLSKMIAPFAPFFAEHMYLKLRQFNDKESVHLEDWPEISSRDEVLEKEMERVKEYSSLILELRNKANIKVRQPLSKATVKGGDLPNELSVILMDEVNVKEVYFDNSLEEGASLDTLVTEDLKVEGALRDLQRAVQDLRKQKGLVPKDVVSIVVEFEGDTKKILDTGNLFDNFLKLVGAKGVVDGEATNIISTTLGNIKFDIVV